MERTSKRELSFWGWGYAKRFPSRVEREATAAQLAMLLGFSAGEAADPPSIDAVEVPASRLKPPPALSEVLSAEDADRVRHTYGRSYRDVVRGFRGDFSAAPDLVAHPASEDDVVALLDWAAGARVAVIPYGGGTNVVGATEAAVGDGFNGTLVMDLRRLDRVLEVDGVSRSARIQAGALGPVLEKQLAEHGLTLRHYPQSFEFSTLGGWIATRSGGHYATVQTRIDDFVESVRMVTPVGVSESRRLPGSGAGPSPDALACGSEGTLGVITEAWMRVQVRPRFRSRVSVNFADFERAVEAVRAVAQSGLSPSNCRLLDAREALLNAVATDGSCVVLLGFESADVPVRERLEAALKLAMDAGGRCLEEPVHREDNETCRDAADRWRRAFFDAPYLQTSLVSLGIIADTFETCTTWDRFPELHRALISNVRAAMKRECGKGFLSCRFTHVYPGGPAPYYTFLAPGRRGGELEQWAAIKQAASQTLLAHGATITHHHAVGRTHRPWYEQQVPEPFRRALAAAKQAIDPAGILNPGALLPARP